MMRVFGLPPGWTMYLVIGAWWAHIFLHLIVLEILFCLLGRPELGGDATYEEIVKMVPHDWFNANKMHCLREKYILKVENPTKFYVYGEVPMREEAKKALAEASAN